MKLRHDPVAMIDLTRSLPTLQDSLTPPQNQVTATEDVMGGLIIAALIIAAIALTFGL
jgi:hypothetical protein